MVDNQKLKTKVSRTTTTSKFIPKCNGKQSREDAVWHGISAIKPMWQHMSFSHIMSWYHTRCIIDSNWVTKTKTVNKVWPWQDLIQVIIRIRRPCDKLYDTSIHITWQFPQSIKHDCKKSCQGRIQCSLLFQIFFLFSFIRKTEKEKKIPIKTKTTQMKSIFHMIQKEPKTPPQTIPYGLITPSSPRRKANREESNGLVKMSANWCSESIECSTTFLLLKPMWQHMSFSHIMSWYHTRCIIDSKWVIKTKTANKV